MVMVLATAAIRIDLLMVSLALVHRRLMPLVNETTNPLPVVTGMATSRMLEVLVAVLVSVRSEPLVLALLTYVMMSIAVMGMMTVLHAASFGKPFRMARRR